MSNILKEPYEITVWEEELIPKTSFHYKKADFSGDFLTEEEYKSSDYKENWVESVSNPGKYYYIYGDGNTLVESLPQESNSLYKYEKVIMEHYEETNGIIIGAHNMDSPYAAANPIFKENVNGSVELGFTLYYKVFDSDTGEYENNPFVTLVANERKIKLHYHNKWYDLIVKNRVEDSSNYSFAYTCKDLYINELNKNGFKVELDTELENNQGTIIDISETILDDTDWEVAPISQKASQNYVGPYSDILVETKVEPLYLGKLSRRVNVEKLLDYVPDDHLTTDDQPETFVLPAGSKVLFFYSEISENKKHPQILCRFGKDGNTTIYRSPVNEDGTLTGYYEMDPNEDIITNACNYVVSDAVTYMDLEEAYDIPSIIDERLSIYEYARGEKVIKSQKSGYDPDTDKFIFKYYKKDDNGNIDDTIEYYGYAKVDILSSSFTQNYLANSEDFVSLDSGWIFEGVPSKTVKLKGVEKLAGYSGQLYEVSSDDIIENRNKTPDSVLVLQLKNQANSEYYPDNYGDYYLTKPVVYENDGVTIKEQPQYVLVSSPEGNAFEENIRSAIFKYRSGGTDGYVDKTDQELDDIINELLTSRRYSTRSRYALNTGIAANRKVIGSLTPGEEYLFAASLGKFKDNEIPPEYKDSSGNFTTIKYGSKIPTEYYNFENIEDSAEFALRAGDAAKEAVQKWLDSENNPYDYYLKNPDYKKAYDKAYNDYIKYKEEIYEDTYTNILNNASEEAIDCWRGGGKKFQTLFKQYLNDSKQFTYIDASGASRLLNFSTSIAIRLLTFCNREKIDSVKDDPAYKVGVARAVYETLIDCPDTTQHVKKESDKENAPIVQHGLYADKGYYYGIYPAMAYAAIDEALIEQDNALLIYKSSWNPMGYDNAQYPEFDNVTGDLAIFNRSFNEMLFSTFYYLLMDRFTIIENNELKWQTDLILSDVSDEKFNTKTGDIQNIIIELFTNAYDKACEQGTWYKAANKAQEYELPSLTNKKGGDIYQQYLHNWIYGQNYDNRGTGEKPVWDGPTNAIDKGQKAVQAEEDNKKLFSIPSVLSSEDIKQDEPLTSEEKEVQQLNRRTRQEEYLAIGNFVLNKEKEFNTKYNISQLNTDEYYKDYDKALREWITEYLGTKPATDPVNKSYYFYYLFIPEFMKNWRENQKVGTYVYNDRVCDLAENIPTKMTYNVGYDLEGYANLEIITDDNGVPMSDPNFEYDLMTEDTGMRREYSIYNSKKKDYVTLNGGKLTPYQTITKKVWRQDETGKWQYEDVTTGSYRWNCWVAVKTKYDPYTHENQSDAAGYVFDRNTKQIRLFDLKRDSLNATFKPIKDDDGDYVFDAFQQQYRPFRDWRNDVKRNPLTLEEDEELGVFGDLIYHPVKWFDGHIGDWTEEPTRYRMVRVRENPFSEHYGYLDEEITFKETGHYDGRDIEYTVTYPAGYQFDNYIPDDKGKYIKYSELNSTRSSLSFLKLKKDGGKVYFNNGDANLFSLTKEKKTFIEAIQDFFNNFLDRDEKYKDGGLKVSNTNHSNSSDLDEDRISEKSYSITQNGRQYFLTSLVWDEIENAAETKQNEDYILNNSQETNAAQAIDTESEVVVAERYIKYKWYYYKHWKLRNKRYRYQEKICVYRNENGVRVYKPFNAVQDAISDDYEIMSQSEIISRNADIAALNEEIRQHNTSNSANPKPFIPSLEAYFYLDPPVATYRQAKESDYGARKYRMDLQDKKKKIYWVETPTGENYLRHYKLGDGEIELWDGHLGKWIECFKEEEVLADATFEGDGWLQQTNGLMQKDDKYCLPDFYLPYEEIMIPYDHRVLSKKDRFTRIRVSDAQVSDPYVYQDSIYLPRSHYHDQYGFTSELNYDNLKISLVDDYSYKSEEFSLILPSERTSYLTFDLSETPTGYMDLVVSEDTINKVTTKERWVYWTAAVDEGISLTKDPFQKFGMLFETTKNAEMVKYPFLGMQLFKNITYEKKIKENQPKNLLTFNQKNRQTVLTLLAEIGYDYPSDKFDKFQQMEDNQETQNAYNNIIWQALGFYFKKNVEDENANPNLSLYEKYYLNNAFANFNIVIEIEEDKENKKNPKLYLIQDTETVTLFPGQVPDTKDLKRTNYYIYDPDTVTDLDNIVYDYVGTKPFEYYEPAYDELCQKIRSIKGKESNYYKLLQDSCDTFDCWVEPIISHDESTGQIQYVEKPIYIQNNNNENEEPQIYVGERQLDRKVFKRITKLKKKYGYVDPPKENPDARIDYIEGAYQWISFKEIEPEQQSDLDELNRLSTLSFDVQYIIVPDKKIRFRRYVGEVNYNGFKYGVNLKHIKRTVDSSQISTRVIVKANKNENATDGFCTIQRATENTLKENFLLDFSYYVQQGLIKNSDLVNDLYTGVNTKLNYYTKLNRLNKDNDQIATELASKRIELSDVKARYDVAMLAYEAALEEIQKLAYTLTSNYDAYGDIIDSPWTRKKSQEYVTKVQTSSPAITVSMSVQGIEGQEPFNVVIDVPETATQVDYPKYNDSLRSLLDQMDIYQTECANNEFIINELKPEKERLELEIQELLTRAQIIVDKKNELNRLFYHKYSRFIQEGSWIDESYIDDNLYYLDALSVLRISSRPKITYDIGVADLSMAIEYEEDKKVLENNLGDRTYVEDVEFFGYRKDGVTPYWEEVVVSEKIYYLEDPSQNQVKVKNYTTQFDDLFQRIAATSQTLQFNEGSFQRAAALVQADGTLDGELFQKTIVSSDFIISNSFNEEVVWDNTGITVTDSTNSSNVLKIVSRGVLVSNDGGNNYKTAITGDGINADLLVAGRIDVGKLLIGDADTPNFFWDKVGLSAFRTDDKKRIDYSSFVRLDQYGIYGISNYNNGENKLQLSFNNSFTPKSIKEITNNPNAIFGLTWDGFFLNASNGTGRVTIGTNQDFKMSEYFADEDTWRDKVIIGRLEDKNGGQYYGFRLKNNNNEIVLDTNDSGELYLKNKLRISNFDERINYSPYHYVYLTSEMKSSLPEEEQKKLETSDGYYYEYSYDDNGGKVINYYTGDTQELYKTEPTDIDWKSMIQQPQDRVTLGIVDVYEKYLHTYVIEEEEEEEDGAEIEPTYEYKWRIKKANVKGSFDSSHYLTKVFSVKENLVSSFTQFSEDDISNVIDDNENFAIFDNGNLYAKNAWIEGHIRAMSGNILGTLEVGSEESQLGMIKHANDSWWISGDGTARFDNIILSGTINKADFAYNEVSTIAGTLLVQPYIKIHSIIKLDTSSKEDYDNYQVILEAQSMHADQTTFYFLMNNLNTADELVDSNKYESTKVGSVTIDSSSKLAITFEVNKNSDFEKVKDQYQYISLQDNSDDIKIVINATQFGLYPEQSISIMEGNTIKAILGKLPLQIFADNTDLEEKLLGTYGLYCDNVFLKGIMLSTDEQGTKVGIDTSGSVNFSIPGTEKPLNAVFFSQTNGGDVTFAVSKDGKLYAQNGYFSGIISTAEIIGAGTTDHALKIRGENADSAFLFYDLVLEGDLEKKVNYMSLTKDGTYFYQKDSSGIFSIVNKAFYLDENEQRVEIKDGIIGMFLDNSSDKNLSSAYLLSFLKTKTTTESGLEKPNITLSFKGSEVATIDETGIHYINGSSGLEGCKTEIAIVQGINAGINFLLL